MRKIRFCVLAILLGIASVALADESSGDEKIKDTRKRIEESVDEEEEKEGSKPKAAKQDDDEEPGLCELIFRLIFEIWAEYSFTVRYAAYPYASPSYDYNASALDMPEEGKLVSFELLSEAAWHLDNTYGEINRLSFRFSALNINLYNQFIFAGNEGFYALSANGGLSFFVPNFMLDLYVGVFGLDFLDRAFVSFGAQVQLFFHRHIYFEAYNLNSFYRGLAFSHVSGCLSYALGRWAVGAGFTYSNYNGFEYLGPLIRLSLWF